MDPLAVRHNEHARTGVGRHRQPPTFEEPDCLCDSGNHAGRLGFIDSFDGTLIRSAAIAEADTIPTGYFIELQTSNDTLPLLLVSRVSENDTSWHAMGAGTARSANQKNGTEKGGKTQRHKAHTRSILCQICVRLLG